MVQAPDLLKELRAAIDPYLTEKTDLKLDVSAKANGSKIAITAKAGGLKKFPDEVRLRLALAEDKIAFVAGNGIRVHDSIVRTMPGGADGIEPEKGELAFTGDVDLLKLKSQLTKYLAKAESNGAEFDEKPLDFKDLHLIAFLQNSDTNEILQAVAVPVAGKLSLEKEAEEPAAAPPEKKKAATSGKSGKK
jgi:hypothetical protein